MSNKLEKQKFEQVVQKFYPQSRLLNVWELKGGVSAQVTALEIRQTDGQMQKMVVRQHGAVDLKQNPQIAADEFKLLQILQSAGIVAPKPYHLDQSAGIFATPYIIIEYIEGKTEFNLANLDDCIHQMAEQLAKIHAVDCDKFDLAFLPNQTVKYSEKLRNRPAKLDESLDEGRIRAVLERVWPLPQYNTTVLLHRDFWPGNIMWQDGRLAAVLDWEDAKLGDPLADVANSRLEILWAFGRIAMDSFTDYYKATTNIDFNNLPYWDLCAGLRPMFKIAEWAGDETTKKKMREGHHLFITQAFKKLALQ